MYGVVYWFSVQFAHFAHALHAESVVYRRHGHASFSHLGAESHVQRVALAAVYESAAEYENQASAVGLRRVAAVDVEVEFLTAVLCVEDFLDDFDSGACAESQRYEK